MPALSPPARTAHAISVSRTQVNDILAMRELHRQEMSCQIIHDSFPQRGLSDPYLIQANDAVVGYGLVANKYYPNTVNEFYVAPPYRGAALLMFRRLLETSGATRIRTQTNDPLLLLMLYDGAANVTPANVLFADGATTSLTCPGGVLRKKGDNEAEWVIEKGGELVASGGILFHYNPPYGDIFMGVEEPYRRRGFGSYLVQELKRICYEIGKVPAARCNGDNLASRKTLQKGGMLPCGRVLEGDVVNEVAR